MPPIATGSTRILRDLGDIQQIEFVKGLLGTFNKTQGVHAVGYVLNLDDLCEVFPETTDRIGDAYYLLTRFMMQTIGDDFMNLGRGSPARELRCFMTGLLTGNMMAQF